MPRTSVKSPDAFRTISEAADALDLPQHVLRFWETRFSQIKPMKRSGGRRYYRPTDIALLQGIRHLLYDEGYTIKGVQRILREQGVAHVAALNDKQVMEAPVDEVSAPLTVPEKAVVQPVLKPMAAVPQPSAAPVLGVQPPHPSVDPVQVAQSKAPPPPPQPIVSAPTPVTPVQPTAVQQATAQPQSIHPVQPAPPPPPPLARTEPVAAPQEAVARPPLGPFSSTPSSSLRFMPDVEAPASTATPPPVVPTVQQAVHPSPSPLASMISLPEVEALPTAVNETHRLSPQDTETLARALRTLLDCKAILDSARQPALKPETTNT